jgi:chemotaxis protein MotA
MSIGTVIAFIGGLALFFSAIIVEASHNGMGPFTALLMYFSLPGLAMVLGGTMASAFISYEARYVLLALKTMLRIFSSPSINRGLLKSEVGRVIRWGYTVQKAGLPALEAETKKLKSTDKFLAFGLDMVIAGYSGEEVRHILHTTIETTFGRNMVPASILKTMGGIGPAFGMVGTLVGMVMMMANMGGDPSGIGSALSVALLATLYGVLSARLIWFPAAEKIKQREEIVRFRNYLVAEGLALLAERKSPRYIQDKMNSYLDPAIHFNIDKMKQAA